MTDLALVLCLLALSYALHKRVRARREQDAADERLSHRSAHVASRAAEDAELAAHVADMLERIRQRESDPPNERVDRFYNANVEALREMAERLRSTASEP